MNSPISMNDDSPTSNEKARYYIFLLVIGIETILWFALILYLRGNHSAVSKPTASESFMNLVAFHGLVPLILLSAILFSLSETPPVAPKGQWVEGIFVGFILFFVIVFVAIPSLGNKFAEIFLAPAVYFTASLATASSIMGMVVGFARHEYLKAISKIGVAVFCAFPVYAFHGIILYFE